MSSSCITVSPVSRSTMGWASNAKPSLESASFSRWDQDRPARMSSRVSGE
jgi:hypothetical protein